MIGQRYNEWMWIRFKLCAKLKFSFKIKQVVFRPRSAQETKIRLKKKQFISHYILIMKIPRPII